MNRSSNMWLSDFDLRRIVIMEDDNVTRLQIGRIVGEIGGEVAEAASLEEVLRLAVAGHKNFILDINMGHERAVEGLDALEQLKAMDDRNFVGVLTNHPKVYQEMAERLGCDVFREKSIKRYEDIRFIVDQMLLRGKKRIEDAIVPGVKKRRNSMWVEPNPFLLHQTDFETAPQRIFVVQSWALRESVFPMLKEILEEADYSVTYAGDRDGQVVFEDVWLMLNEAEAVLVDFTDRRPNVYLEYGMALVLGKPIVAITQKKEHIPSDTPNLKYVLYDDSMRTFGVLKTRLPRAIQTMIEDLKKLRDARSSDD